MNTYRTTARMVGLLYIIGTVSGILSVAFAGTIIDDPAYLTKMAEHENRIALGALMILSMGLSLALIPALMFPLLKRSNEVLAMGYVVFRSALETFTYLMLTLFWLLLLTLSQRYVDASLPDVAYFQNLGAVLQDASDWVAQILVIVFILGALMFYYVLYQTRLVPRWLSAWGILASIPYILSAPLVLFTVIEPNATTQNLLEMPLALQEMVLAIWLIVRGFSLTDIPLTTDQTK